MKKFKVKIGFGQQKIGKIITLTEIFLNLLKYFPPETAHQLTIFLLKMKISKNNNILDDAVLKQRLFGLDFLNPLGLAAGFDKNAEVVIPMLNLGLGFVVVGTSTPKSQKGYIKPRVFRLKEDLAIINHLGFNNKGCLKTLERLKILNSNP